MSRPRLLPGLSLLALSCLALSACFDGSPDEDEFAFGESEMRAAIEGDWSGDLMLDGRAPTALTLRLEYQPPGVAPACVSRTLGAGPLCSSTSMMRVKGALSTADGAYSNAPLVGWFTASGEELRGGYLALGLDEGSSFDADLFGGTISSGRVSKPTAESDGYPLPIGTFTLRR